MADYLDKRGSMSGPQAPTPPPEFAALLMRLESRLVRLETRLVRYMIAQGFTPEGDPPQASHPAQLELFPKD